MRETINRAEASKIEFEKQQAGPKGDRTPPPGATRYVVPSTLDGSPVPEGGLARARMMERLVEQERESSPAAAVLPGSEITVERRRPPKGYDTSEYG